MLQVDFGTIYRSEERRLAAGTTGVLEGQALVADYENGELVVKPSAGTSGEVFVGVAISSVSPIKSLAIVEVLTSGSEHLADGTTDNPNAKKVTLAHTPTVTPAVYEGTTMTGTALAHRASTATSLATNYHRDGKEVTLHKHDTAYTFVYRYSPTVLEVLNLQGDAEPGTHVSDTTETIGVITAGEVFTGEWVTTVKWSGTSDIHTGASGRFTTATTGSDVNGIVTKVPDSETGLLGFRFSA